MAHDLVLSSGFLAFARHAGFLAAVEELRLPVDGLCGTSSGALVGSLWVAGMPARRVLELLTAHAPLAWCRPHVRVWRGLFVLDGMMEELARHLPTTIEELPLAFGAGVVAPDGHEVVRAGRLVEAVAASCAVPWLFAPVAVGGRSCVDGARADRLGLGAWREARPDRPLVVHAIDRTGGVDAPTDLGGARLVRSARSGASLWSLGDVQRQFEESRLATLTQLRPG
ncbi:MAG: patatin-like phospholipase family protein [Alphaproteobacteria bacterium]|nr:patatin-like phospholipase family protein [Alphaproteobacteria bacterium]MCB9696821.1 patatin-like phospholipase family protein [Alphaproteobacteria bacterium]